MNEADLLDRIRDDLRSAPSQTVIYLEGRTDPDFLFALLGIPSPSDGLHQGVLVKGLRDEGGRRGSGSNAVANLVELAIRSHLNRVFGVVDGDGQTLDVLRTQFDPPCTGPLFRWKAYCIENLIVRTGWPTIWGDEPDWQNEFANYGPYLALNRIGQEVKSLIKDLGLENFTKPILGEPLRLSSAIAGMLATGKLKLQSYDVEQRFGQELLNFEEMLHRDINEAHALLNGKWLIRHMAPTLTKRDTAQCQYDWLAHSRSSGGLSEVREWWERVTGSAP